MIKPPARKSPPGREVSKDEEDLWQQVTDGVEPLPESHDLVDEPQTEPAVGEPAVGEPVKETPAPENAAPPVFTPPPPRPAAEPALTHGSAPGLDKRTQTNLRRGKVKIEARVDLHGMTQDEAHAVLGDFLADSQVAGRRSVLVITGKGRGKDGGGTGVLREAVPKWLNESGNKRMIRAFSHAQPKDGGEGALYVLLKRLK